MDIHRIGDRPSTPGLPEYFTGAVRLDPLFQASAPARAMGASVTFEPGEKHGHGATATVAMTHVAIQEALDGSAVEWLEHVSEAQYSG